MTILPSRLAALLLLTTLAACGGSNDDGADPAPGPGGDAGGDTGADSGDGGDVGGGDTAGGGTGGGGDPALDGADLAHAGTALAVNPIDPADAPLVSAAGRARAESLAEPLGVIYEVVENHGEESGESCRALGAEYGSCSVTNLHIRDAEGVLNDGGWRLYFHSLRRVLRVDSDEFVASHVNGDLHFLEPSDGFDGFEDGVESVKLFVEFSQLMQSDFLPRYWLVRDGAEPLLLPNTATETDEDAYSMPITGENRRAFNGEPIPLADPAARFAANADVAARAARLSAREVQSRIVPAPRRADVGTGSLDISGGLSFGGTDLGAAAIEVLESRLGTFGPVGRGVPLTARIDASLPAGTHTLDVSAGGVAIAGADAEALFHGAQSLLSLVQPGVGTIPAVAIVDGPRFAHRGMHVDVARNFQSLASIDRLLEQMAAYKLNRLHLHLSDDEGWRLEIPGLPELTEVGARRAFELDADGAVLEANALMPQLGSGPGSDNAGTGHFSREEFVALLRRATARHIEVIPEFDMPGHARAAVIAMRARAARLGTPTDTNVRIDDPDDTSRYVTIQHYDDGILNPCVPGTYAFLETVVDEVAAMYAEAGAPLEVWHMGGDEARNIQLGAGYPEPDTSRWEQPWEASPACASYIAETPDVASRDDLERHFVERVARIVADASIPRLYAWHEILDGLDAAALATAGAGTTYWRPISRDGAIGEAAGFVERGYETVLSAPDFLYFDFPQEVDPEERGQYWGTRYSDVAKVFSLAPENLSQNAETSTTNTGRAWQSTATSSQPAFTGMQGHLWSELTRTPEQFDFMIFPRLLALAERAWHRADWELDYAQGTTYSESSGLVDKAALASDLAGFAAALGRKELPKLDAAGIAYRIPVPGASSAGGVLEMNLSLPGLPLEYSMDGQRFTRWQSGQDAADATVVRALSADGTRAGRADRIE